MDYATTTSEMSHDGDGESYVTEFILLIIIIIAAYIVYKLYVKSDGGENSGIEISRDKTILDIFKRNAKKYPDFPALMVGRNRHNWGVIPYKTYYENALKFAKSINYWLGKTGVNVAIMGFNSPAWFYAHLGCLFNGGISIGIHPKTSSEHCKTIVNDNNVDILIVENEKYLRKFNKCMQNIKVVLYYSPIKLPDKYEVPVINYSAFIDSEEKDTVKLPYKPHLDDVVSIIYTSGSLKPVVIKHLHIINSIAALLSTLNRKTSIRINQHEHFVSYLPLNYMTAQMMDIYIPIVTTGTVWFANKVKNTLVDTLKEVKPSLFLGTPDVWKMIMKQKKASFFNLMGNIGLGECKYCVTTGQKVSDDVLDYFDGKLFNIYGLAELGPVTVSAPECYMRGSVGVPLDGVKLKVDKNGEILVKREKRWIKTGDVGYLKDGFLFIIGKKI